MIRGIKRISGLLAGCAAFLLPVQAFASETDMTLKENLGFAAQNTVVGIVTVFALLLLMALVIYLFRFLPKLVNLFRKRGDTGQEQQAEEKNSAAAPPPSAGQETAPPLTDDAQLVAVITAAIAASREQEAQTPVGSFVVRTIKKRA